MKVTSLTTARFPVSSRNQWPVLLLAGP
jgi:hypothetical protein